MLTGLKAVNAHVTLLGDPAFLQAVEDQLSSFGSLHRLILEAQTPGESLLDTEPWQNLGRAIDRGERVRDPRQTIFARRRP